MPKCTPSPSLPCTQGLTGSSILANRSWEVCEGRQFWDRTFSSLIKEESMQRGISFLPPWLHRWSCKGWCCCNHHILRREKSGQSQRNCLNISQRTPWLPRDFKKKKKTPPKTLVIPTTFNWILTHSPKHLKKYLAKNEPERGWIISKLYN